MKYGSEYDEKPNSWNFGGVRRTYVPGDFYGHGPKSYKRPDERILDDVCYLLTVNGDVDASEIHVRVSDGVVHLKGEVPSRNMKRLAEQCLEDVHGVRDIDNALRVQGSRSPGHEPHR